MKIKLPEWKLYFDTIKNNYFWIDDCCTCSFCNQEILNKEQLLIREYWGKKYFDFDIACFNCFNKVKKHKKVKGLHIEKKIAFCLNSILQLPSNSIMVCLQPPEFVNGRYRDSFEAATNHEIGVKIKNNCKWSFNPQRNVCIEEDIKHRNIKELDRPVNTVAEAESILKSLQSAIPIIPKRIEHKEKRLLE
jgi:hypothetical protein